MNEFTELLRQRGLKLTAFRSRLLDIFSSHNTAIEQKKLETELGDFDRVTLYRNLQSLTQAGVLHKAIENDNQTYYAICPPSCTSDSHEHEHVHFVCDSCERVSCIEVAHFPRIQIEGYQIESVDIKLQGVCDDCR